MSRTRVLFLLQSCVFFIITLQVDAFILPSCCIRHSSFQWMFFPHVLTYMDAMSPSQIPHSQLSPFRNTSLCPNYGLSIIPLVYLCSNSNDIFSVFLNEKHNAGILFFFYFCPPFIIILFIIIMRVNNINFTFVCLYFLTKMQTSQRPL